MITASGEKPAGCISNENLFYLNEEPGQTQFRIFNVKLCVVNISHMLFANLVKKTSLTKLCKCASVSVIIKIYAASQSDPQTRTENAEQGKIQDLASEY